MHFRSFLLAGASMLAALAFSAGAQAQLCGSPGHVPSSTKCHSPHYCKDGSLTDGVNVGGATVKVGGPSSHGRLCCLVVEFVPDHDDYGPGAFLLQPVQVHGWTKSGTCEPVYDTILWGLITIHTGDEVCVYSAPTETTLFLFFVVGNCD